MNSEFINLINKNIDVFSRLNESYKTKIKFDKINNLDDFKKIPFMDREDLYNLNFNDTKKYIRIHSTSGTTGNPIIIPYTKKDIKDWTNMMCRCYEIVGINSDDIIQIATGYGLWTAGVGFQLGCEKLGAMAIPIGCDNTDKQFEYFKRMKSTVLCATSSYGIYLSEKIKKNEIYLKKGIFGSEIWGEKTRKKIEKELNIKCYDIYGMTETYGPGIAISCNESRNMHYWNDYFYFEIIDPITKELLPNGNYGELVITTLKKEGVPLIRYRTHDITRIIDEKCICGNEYPQIAQIVGRSDEMIKFHGVKLFPKQFEIILDEYDELSPKYQIIIKNIDSKDTLYFKCEYDKDIKLLDYNIFQNSLKEKIKKKLGINAEVIIESKGSLPNNIGKTKHIYDLRNKV